MAVRKETVLLLHGLLGRKDTMAGLAERLGQRGHRTVNLTYRSTRLRIDEVAAKTLAPAIAFERAQGRRVHIVTHSLGGLVARRCFEMTSAKGVGRVVMLAPPARGARVLRDFARVAPVWPIVRAVLGPAARELAGMPSDPAPFGGCELGVIAASRRSPLLDWYFGEAHDGKLAVSETRVDGMRDFWVSDRTHADLMDCPEVTARVATFLEQGAFGA
jgi:pimeloyl-ACP methyl ester carboxylesterase